MLDAVVLGLGAHGSAAAYHLARRGLRVLGVERFAPAHDRGSSHGGSRIIRKAYFEHPDYVPLLVRSYELWRALETSTGRSLLTITGGLHLGRAGSAVFEGARVSAARHGVVHEVLDAAAVARRFPTFAVREDTVACREDDAGVLKPEDGIRAHVEAAVAAGAELRFGVRARLPGRPFSSEDGPVAVEVGSERVLARRVVLAAGAWLQELSPELGFPLRLARQVMFWFRPRDPAPFAPDRFPIFIWDVGHEMFYGFPRDEEGLVKVAFHHGGETVPDPDDVRREVGEAERARMEARIAESIPRLAGKVVRAKTCLYANTRDEHFALGLRGGGRVVVVSACSGHGYKFAPVIGEIAADLAADGATRHPIDLFSLDRPGLRSP